MATPRKIVFNMPSLLPEGGAAPRGASGTTPAAPAEVADRDVIDRTVVSGSLAEAVEAFESNLIQNALKTTGGNRAGAARLLSTTERIINYKIRRYRIEPRLFRD